MSATKDSVPAAALALRKPDTVMRLARLGAFHQTRLSFMRALLRRLKREQWRFDRPVWRIDGNGVGVAVYAARGHDRTYSLICYAHDLAPEKRSDRVIAEAWDATFALFDGEPTPADVERLATQVPKQEAGRCSETELVLSRANRSVRLFEHVVDALAAGRQPEQQQIDAVGYVMRTTAVYGNGKFGLGDRGRISGRAELRGPFRAELLSVWLIRAFTVDLVEHLARCRAPETAVTLERNLRRRLGVGNATGLGMAPFVVNHPALLHAWIAAREEALGRVLALASASEATSAHFHTSLARARLGVAEWHSADARQSERIVALARDLEQLAQRVSAGALAEPYPWRTLYQWASRALTLEGQEMLVSLLIEPHGDLVDDLAERMAADEEAHFRIDGTVPIGELRETLAALHAWALAIDYEQPAEQARFWYVSEEKLEPRLGERFDEPGAEKEQPLAIGRAMAALNADLRHAPDGETVARFLLRHPEHRQAIRRVQLLSKLPYAEIRDNLIAASMLPIDLLRCKLSFFGATKFDPRSDRWVRITMYQGAPFPDELDASDADDWAYPPLGNAAP